MGDIFNVLRCIVRDWSLSSRSCRQATRLSQVIVVVTEQNLEAKKKTLSHPLFVLFFVSLSLFFGHVVLTLTENRPEDVDFKRNKVT